VNESRSRILVSTVNIGTVNIRKNKLSLILKTGLQLGLRFLFLWRLGKLIIHSVLSFLLRHIGIRYEPFINTV